MVAALSRTAKSAGSMLEEVGSQLSFYMKIFAVNYVLTSLYFVLVPQKL